MSAEDLHQSSGSCQLTPEPSTASLKIKEENVEYANQNTGTLHVGKTDVLPWKGREGNSFNFIPQSEESDFIACENCSEESNYACAFCCMCTEFLCKVCHESHKRSRKLSQHNVIPFDKETGKQLQSITKVVAQLCPQLNHNGNLTQYCVTCKCLICQDCFNGLHNGHTSFLLPSGEKGDQSESEKNIALECAQDIMKKLTAATEINDSMIQQLETQKQICSQDVKRAFESLYQALKGRENALLSKLEVMASSKMAPLLWWKQESEKIALNTRQYAEMVSRGQITVAHTELQRIQLTVDGYSIRHGEQMALKVLLQQFNEIPKHLAQLGDVVDMAPSPSNSTWSSASVAKANVSYRVEVETRSTNDVRYTCGGLKLIAKLTSKAYRPEFVITGQVEDHGDGTYTAIFTVSAAGTYQLQILIDGQHIKRSPSDIEVVANFAYFNLQQVIQVSGSNPLCVVLDNQGNLYSGHSNGIIISDKAGILKNHISKGIGCVSSMHLQGDVLYVADSSSNCIRKATMAGELIDGVKLQTVVSNPNSVVLDCHNRIIVSDYGNHRIQIYAEDGRWLLSIDGASYGFSTPRCIALDPQGNIHVACNLNAIMVFTPQGTLDRMYGDVKEPTGIAIDKEGYSIVCEAGGSLTVFHPCGKKVYSTRNPCQPLVRTPHLYDLSSPQGVAMDPTGSTLYVVYKSNIVVVINRSM